MDLPKIIKKTNHEIEFTCGCKIPLTRDGVPNIDYDNINRNCSHTYNLISEGFVKNLFQLESSLGQHYSKEVKPRTIDDISLLISIIRPSTLRAKDLTTGQSIANSLIKRRNGEEDIKYIHPILESLLKDTYGFLNYQEQIMKASELIAGFTPSQANTLLKGIGKKKVEIIAGLKVEFMNGCKNTGLIDEESAKQVFVSMEAAAAYSFNRCVSAYTSILFTDNKSELLHTLFNNPSIWKNRKTYSLKQSERPVRGHITDTLLKYHEVVENEIEDIKYAGEQTVYSITLKRRNINDRSGEGGDYRKHFSLVVTGNHKHPTRCHGEVKTSDLIPGVHSLYCYDQNQAYRPKYMNAASKVIRVDKVGIQPVYDVTMKAPYHNFLCDGVFTCNSHSVGYGTQTYITAWVKTHFPIEFYTSNLRLNETRGGKKEKLEEEKSGMIKEAELFDIHIKPPTSRFPLVEFGITDNNTIHYGISNVRMTGEKEAKAVIDGLKPDWLSNLFCLGETVKSISFENLCLVGFFDGCLGAPTRQRMVYEYKTYRKLSVKETEWIKNRLEEFKNFEECIIGLLGSTEGKNRGISTKARIPKIEDFLKTLQNPPHSLEDTPLTINKAEKELLGVAITYSDIEARTLCNVYTDTTCKEFLDGKNAKDFRIAASIIKVKEHKDKRGNTMSFCSCSDNDSVIECVAFSNVYSEFGNLLFEKNTVVINGVRNNKTFIINKVEQI